LGKIVERGYIKGRRKYIEGGCRQIGDTNRDEPLGAVGQSNETTRNKILFVLKVEERKGLVKERVARINDRDPLGYCKGLSF
jgi:hypothetical protein